MGLYGTIVVDPADPDYWPPVHREIALTLDDILLEDGAVAPFSRSQTTHTAMGRFGNVLLVDGEPDLTLTARRRRGRSLLPGEHREHPGLQRRAPRGPDEARRRRQRPLRTRTVRRGRSSWPRPSGSSSTCCSPSPGELTLEHHTPTGPTRSPRSPSPQSTARRRPGRRVRARCAPTRTWPPNATGSRPTCDAGAGQDARVRRRDGHRRRPTTAPRGLRLPDAPGGDQRRTRPLPGLRDETAARAPGRSTAGTATTRPPARQPRATARPRPRGGRRASSGRTTWSRSTG